jgi:hypothetical protein
VAEVDGLGALEMRVAGQRPVEVRLGGVGQRRHQPLHRGDRLVRGRAREQRDVGGDLVVARACGVQLAADRPGDLGKAALDRHVDVFVVGREREAAVA